MIKLWWILLSFSFSVWANIPGVEPAQNHSVSGYVKYMLNYTGIETSDNSLDHLIHQRLNVEYQFSTDSRVNVGMRNRVIWGDRLEQSDLYREYIHADLGYMDLSKEIGSGDNVTVNTQLDRFYLTHHVGDSYGRLGRFRVNWSMNSIWNPNDLLNVYSIYDFDYEERPGTDAMLIGKNLDVAEGIEGLFSPDKDADHHRYLLRYYGNNSGWDYQIITGQSYSDYVIGSGFVTDVEGAGVSGELTWFESRDVLPELQLPAENLVASLEMNNTLSGETNATVAVAWLYIKNTLDRQNLAYYLALPTTAQTMSFTHNTLYAEFSWDITSLNRMLVSGSYYQDNSYFFGLSNQHSLLEDLDLLTVIQYFDGSGSSLFGQTPAALLYVNVKWSY